MILYVLVRELELLFYYYYTVVLRATVLYGIISCMIKPKPKPKTTNLQILIFFFTQIVSHILGG